MDLATNFKRSNLYHITLIAILCAAFYIFGIWQHSNAFVPRTASKSLSSTATCVNQSLTSPRVVHPLDFQSHHTAPDPPPTLAPDFYFPPCDPGLSEYTPCEDAKRSLKFPRERLQYRERHCPGKAEVKKCRIPAPYGYKLPFPWPMSREVVWFANVPHKELTVEKKRQNWVRYQKDRFWFPGGGTMFPRGADAYVDNIGHLINLRDGSIRTALDTGCGVASFGAYLLSRNIITMSFAPRDTHEAQVQFALERGVPALIGIMATIRLPYPSRAFDMAHCSRCLIPWGKYDGIYLTEIDRILRPGGYWILSGPPINWQNKWRGWNRTRQDLDAEQVQIESVARSLCWKKVVQREDLAIWRKPNNHVHCQKSRKFLIPYIPFCEAQDPDMAWYTKLETCITPLPQANTSNLEVGAGAENAKWPKRLNRVPPRIITGIIDGVTPEAFVKNSELWRKRVSYYKSIHHQLSQQGKYRNILDMNAYLGGFAAALIDDPVWVMNVVPVEASVNTLGVVYERGLIGTYQNWCEAMSTYPRTYDLVHAAGVFSLYKEKCEMEEILLEMDRILRPNGAIIIREDVDAVLKAKRLGDALQWQGRIVDHEQGPREREKLYVAVKHYWTAPPPSRTTKNIA